MPLTMKQVFLWKKKNATKKTALLPLSDPRINICNNWRIYLKDKALWHSYNSVGHHSSAEIEHSLHVHLCLFWYRNFMQVNTMKKKSHFKNTWHIYNKGALKCLC